MSARRQRRPQRSMRGFTLLEVLIAVALLGLALVMVVESQAVNAAQTRAARNISIASMLAREKMGEVEIDIQKKESFDDLDENCGSGDFDDQGYPNIDWECKNEPLKLNMDPEQLMTALEAIGNGDAEGGLLQMAAEFGGMDLANLSSSPEGQLLLQFFPLMAETLEKAIRRITLKISWEERGNTVEFPVVMYLTDPTRVTNPLGLPGTTPQTGSGGGTTVSPVNPTPRQP